MFPLDDMGERIRLMGENPIATFQGGENYKGGAELFDPKTQQIQQLGAARQAGQAARQDLQDLPHTQNGSGRGVAGLRRPSQLLRRMSHLVRQDQRKQRRRVSEVRPSRGPGRARAMSICPVLCLRHASVAINLCSMRVMRVTALQPPKSFV